MAGATLMSPSPATLMNGGGTSLLPFPPLAAPLSSDANSPLCTASTPTTARTGGGSISMSTASTAFLTSLASSGGGGGATTGGGGENGAGGPAICVTGERSVDDGDPIGGNVSQF